jgi:hypothetical protein
LGDSGSFVLQRVSDDGAPSDQSDDAVTEFYYSYNSAGKFFMLGFINCIPVEPKNAMFCLAQ